MATKPSDASMRPWIWAIEALASFDQVDTSILIDLVKMAPGEISERDGRNAREMVSLRILESLSAQAKREPNGISPNLECNAGLNPSEQCEEVLRQVLRKSSGSNEKSIGLENVEPLIQQKRSRVCKCSLQKLKAAIFEDNHLLPTSLKERSGLVNSNLCNGNTQMHEGHNSDTQRYPPTRNPLPSKRVINESPTENHGESSVCNQLILYNPFNPYINAVKMLKQDASCTYQAIEGCGSVPQERRLLKDVSERSVQDRGEGSDLPKEPLLGGLKESMLHENVDHEDSAAKRRKMSSDVDDAELPHNKLKGPRDDQKLFQNISGVELDESLDVHDSKEDAASYAKLRTLSSASQAATHETNFMDKAKEKCMHSFPPKAPNSACSGEEIPAMGHGGEPKNSSDASCQHDEHNDVIVKRYTLLSSQCTYSQDSLGTVNGTEQVCMKCGRGGQLLACSSDACARVVHEGCLGFAVTFDARMSFYCPFCAYSRAISEYMDSKKRASIARKDLMSFTGSHVEYPPNNTSKKLQGADQKQISEFKDLDDCTVQNSVENNANKVTKPRSRENTEDVQPSVSFDSPCGGRDMTSGRNVQMQENRVEEMSGSSMSCQFPSEQEQQIVALQNCAADISLCRGSEQLAGIEKKHKVLYPPNYVTHVEDIIVFKEKQKTSVRGSLLQIQQTKGPSECLEDCEVHNSKCNDMKIVHGSKQPVGIKQKDAIHLPHVVSLHKSGKPPHSDEEESSVEENRESKAFHHSLRLRKREMQNTYSAAPQSRRKKVPWTNAEEEALKEGVQRFASDQKNIPWRMILESGSEIFEKSRTAMDLKDKWRNLCKGTPNL